MSLDDIIKVNVTNMPTRDDSRLGERYDLTFDVYRTVAFERELMRQYIGFGNAVFDSRGEFHGFDASVNPGMLNIGVWLALVPVAYSDQIEYGAMYPIWDRLCLRWGRSRWLRLNSRRSASKRWSCSLSRAWIGLGSIGEWAGGGRSRSFSDGTSALVCS